MNDVATLTEKILKYAFKVHSALGPGLLESAYKQCLYYELVKNGIYVEKEKVMPLYYEEIKMDAGFRADIIIADMVIVELKSINTLAPVHYKQVQTYLKLTNLRLRLLINFNVNLIKDGIHRVVNKL